jgi:glyoxylase-like metal-dependent hydrolase (beta-lactamase superfamily II)
MIFQQLVTGPLMVNCYILGDEATGEAVVVDPGGDAPDVMAVLERNNLTLSVIANTHCHWDHTGGNADLKKLAGGRILIHPAEKPRDFQPDGFIRGGEEITFGPNRLEVIDTPGHSPGGISLYLASAKTVLVGDLLFSGSIGRTDLEGGSFELLLRSVREKIFPLGDDVRVLPGHGPSTTVAREKRFNPFLRGV